VTRSLHARSLHARFGALLALALASAALSPFSALAQQRYGPLRSASEFLSPELKAEQTDPDKNRGLLWVDQGRSLWQAPQGQSVKSCESCHGDPNSMRGVATRYPQVQRATGHLLNLEARINACRTGAQQAEALPYDSNELLGLTALIASQSNGLKPSPAIDGEAQPFFETGLNLWNERQGQLNLACSQCHDANVGRTLRGDTISSGVTTGYPVYRLEWQGLGSLHRRLRACQLGVRAQQFPQGSPEYLALELYLAWRARDLPIEAPALRR
jgi:L-cysteine S-thiosulfotransferase